MTVPPPDTPSRRSNRRTTSQAKASVTDRADTVAMCSRDVRRPPFLTSSLLPAAPTALLPAAPTAPQ